MVGQVLHSDVALSVRGLRKSFGAKRVLDGVDLDLRRGEVVSLLGANGSGKSTTLRCVMGLMPDDGGEITLSGRRIDTLSGAARGKALREAAMVFQKIHLVPRRTVLANVCAGGFARVGAWSSLSPALYPKDLQEEAMACLDRVGLADRAHDRAAGLSGGQQQRVAIARALCQRADVLLADEPVSALDPRAAEQVMALLHELAHAEHIAVAAVLHQPDLARRYTDRAVGLLGGRVLFTKAVDALTEDDLDTLYLPDRTDASADDVLRELTLEKVS